MKKLFAIGIILVLFLSIISSYGEQNEIGYDKLLNSFQKTNANFEEYNVNGHALINDKFFSFSEMEIAADKIIKEFNLDSNKLKYVKTNKDKFRQLYIYEENKRENGILIIVESEICENIKETHIIVDISKNEVYKDIVENYAKIENALSSYSTNLDIYSCITGSFKGMISNNNYDRITKNVLYNMNGKEIERIEEKDLLSVTAYSNELKDYIKYNSNKVNLNVSLRYSEYDDKTFIYIGTPLIILEY